MASETALNYREEYTKLTNHSARGNKALQKSIITKIIVGGVLHNYVTKV